MSTVVSSQALPVVVVFHGDWGVSTGAGIAGGVDAVVEKDDRGLPVVRGTVLAGAVREQAFVVAQALDGGDSGGWHDFVEALVGTADRSRLVAFTDAHPAEGSSPDGAVHEVVSLSIDPRTGTAELLESDLEGRPVTWTQDQRRGAELVLASSGLLVRAIGSNRSDGDGLCDVLIGSAGGAVRPGDPAHPVGRMRARSWCGQQLAQWKGPAPQAPKAQEDEGPDSRPGKAPVVAAPAAYAGGQRRTPAGRQTPALWQAGLDLVLRAPVISYEVPFSNEIRSLDFLRGTALLPVLHHRLRAAFPDDELVRDAVVRGDLLVSDATAVAGGVRGLPVPLVLSRPKMSPEDAGAHDRSCLRVHNRLMTAEPEEVHTPLRRGYVFPGLRPSGLAQGAEADGSIGAPALVGRQSTAHDPLTGAAGSGQLFMTRALPGGLHLQAVVTMSERLYRHVESRVSQVFPPTGFPERLGSRRLSGTYGRAHCSLGSFGRVESPPPVWDGEGTTTVWLTSDTLVRSRRLGPGGSTEDLVAALAAAGARVELVDPDRAAGRFTAGVRHRRVDSWAGADRQPRATRMAIRAGSVLRVRAAEGAGGCDPGEVMAALVRLSATGVGELTAQGFGRFVVGHPLLSRDVFGLVELRQEDLVVAGSAVSEEER